MEFEVEAHPAVHVVRLGGDLGHDDDAGLRRMFVSLVKEDRLRVLLDMRKVAFLDSTALGTLVWGLKNLRERGGDLRIFGLHDFVANLFRLTMLDKAIQTFPDEAAGMDSYAADA